MADPAFSAQGQPYGVPVAQGVPAEQGQAYPGQGVAVAQIVETPSYEQAVTAPAYGQPLAVPIAGQPVTVPIAMAVPVQAQPVQGQLYSGQPVQGQPVQGQPVGAPAGEGDFDVDNGICDCCSDCEACCLSCLFSPFPWAQARANSGEMVFINAFLIYGIPWGLSWLLSSLAQLFVPEEKDYDGNYGTYRTYNDNYEGTEIPTGMLTCYIFSALFAAINVAIVYYYRIKFKEVYRMRADGVDLVLALCCQCCVIAQEYRHAKLYPRGAAV